MSKKRVVRRDVAVLFIVLGLSAVFALGCARTRHSVEPFKSDVGAGAELTTRAQDYCSAHTGPDARQPIRPFVTDGCSGWPDGDTYVACCVEHDIRYWCGGSSDDRRQVDDEFGACVEETNGRGLGSFMRLGVRFGGHPMFPTPYRWGYGYSYLGSYPPTESIDR